MKKLILVMLGLAICTASYASDTSKVELRTSISNETTTVEDSGLLVKVFASGARQQNSVTLANGFNNISIPSGAKAAMVDIGTNTNLVLKGVTADKGISLDSACPILFPISLDGSTTFGITNMTSDSKTVMVYFL